MVGTKITAKAICGCYYGESKHGYAVHSPICALGTVLVRCGETEQYVAHVEVKAR